MGMNYKLSSIFLALGLAFGAGSVSAGQSVSSVIPFGRIQLSDNSAEYLIDRDNDGLLSVGDSLRGIFSINTVEGLVPPSAQVTLGANGINELTGMFQVVLAAKVPTGPGTWNMAFAPDPSWGQAPGVVAKIYDDSALDFDRAGCANFAACEATATNGNLWMEAGMTSLADFWVALGINDNPSQGATLPLNTPFGTFWMGLSILTNNTGWDWNQVNCLNPLPPAPGQVRADICGQGGVFATGRNNFDPITGQPDTVTPYDIWDNVDFTMNRAPEPASIALLGLGLLGIGAGRMRRASK